MNYRLSFWVGLALATSGNYGNLGHSQVVSNPEPTFRTPQDIIVEAQALAAQPNQSLIAIDRNKSRKLALRINANDNPNVTHYWVYVWDKEVKNTTKINEGSIQAVSAMRVIPISDDSRTFDKGICLTVDLTTIKARIGESIPLSIDLQILQDDQPVGRTFHFTQDQQDIKTDGIVKTGLFYFKFI